MKVWILIFVCMFSMPLLVAVLHFRMRKGQILKIRQDYEKNARYFGRSFSALVEKALPEMKNGMIMLSRQEKVLETDGNQEFVQPEIEDLVIARNTIFCPQQGDLHFQKEIYSEKDALFVKENIRLRAVYSKKDWFSEIGSGFSDGQTQNMQLQFMMNVIWVKGYQAENSL